MSDRSNRGNTPPLSSATVENDAGQESVYTRLRTQVEFYFSPKNLSRDTYLRNMLTSEHVDIPTPRPAQYMCPVGIVTNFPKVKDICSQFSPRLQKEPAALLLARALDGSTNVVTISSDGNWIGPANQILPPPTMVGVLPAGMEGAMGQLPPRIPPQYQPQGYQHHQLPTPMQGMMGAVPPPPPPPPQPALQQKQQRGEGQGYPIATGPSPMGTESPSSTSLESLPQQQQQQQQQAYVSNLPPTTTSSKASVGGGTQSAASLSSMSDPGAKGGHSIPFMGPQGGVVGDVVPSGLPMTDHTANTQPPNSMPPPLQRMFPPGYPWPGGMQHPPQPFPYYPPQQMMQQAMYTQQGGAPQQFQQMQPYPAYAQMGFGVPHPPPQQHNYPPPFHPYHGMQHYVDYGGGGGGMQYHGYPPPPPHPSHFHDNRYPEPGYFHSNDQHQHYGGAGQKRRVEKKKHKNNPQPQQQYQQNNYQRDTYASNTSSTIASKNNESSSEGHQNLPRRGSPSPPIIGEHHRGGNGGNKFKKSGEQHTQHRRDHGNASPSGFNNRSYIRQKPQHQQLQHQHGDRSLNSDANPPASSNRQQERQIKADENRDIFTSSDFPGLGGGETVEQQVQIGDRKPNSNLVGYASALMKKKDVPNAAESKPHVSKSMAPITTPETAPSPTKKNAENHNQSPEEVEPEIQSGLQVLHLDENDGNDKGNSKQRDQSDGNDNDADGETEGCSTSTGADVASEQPVTKSAVSIISPAKYEPVHSASESLSTISRPVIDVFNADDFPARESSNKVATAGGPSLLSSERAVQSSEVEVSNDPPKPTLPGAWGSRRLFADVSFFTDAFPKFPFTLVQS